jgi:glutamate formiminotransferase
MGLIAVPNVSEGRDVGLLRRLGDAVRGAGAILADIHSDAVHNRSVLTVSGAEQALVAAMTQLAGIAREIDLSHHQGVHPRLGGLDVCPVVPHRTTLDAAVPVALSIAENIAARWELPVYLYGSAARRSETRELPNLRRGGLSALRKRAEEGLTPDFGPKEIDEKTGVVCVGARDVLIAFNVWLDAGVEIAEQIAAQVREGRSGLPGLRALGLSIDPRTSQVSMNLTRPEETGIDAAFEAVEAEAGRWGVRIAATEIVGVPPERFMPDPKREAARLLKKPGRSLENALA